MFDQDAFVATPSQYVLGNAHEKLSESCEILRTYNENANVRKHFYFGERFQGILQVDYFNLFNRTQYSTVPTLIAATALSDRSQI